MYKLSTESTIKVAKEFTIIAMQNGLIPQGQSPEKAAKNVVEFYQTVLETINDNNGQ